MEEEKQEVSEAPLQSCLVCQAPAEHVVCKIECFYFYHEHVLRVVVQPQQEEECKTQQQE